MAEDDVPSGPSATAAPAAVPQWPYVAGFAAFVALLCADSWQSPWPDMPFARFLVWIGTYLIIPPLIGWIGWGIGGLRRVLPIVPIYLVVLVRPLASMTVGWEGGWILGIAGAAAGALAGAAAGWLFARWTPPEIRNNRACRRGVRPPDPTDGSGPSRSMAEPDGVGK